MTQRIIPIESPYFIAADHLEKRLDITELYGNRNPLALEIGCGTGHFIISRAQQQPNINFLAIDIYNKGCWKTCKKLDANAGIDNVRVMRIEARHLLEKGLGFESLVAMYINCPDPWPKKRHRDRRLVNRDFLQTVRHYLRPGGDFYFSTDFIDYALDVAGHLNDMPGYQNMLNVNFVHRLPDYPLSKYMQRFMAQGQPIYFLHHRRDPSVSRDRLACPEFERGFRVPMEKANHG